MKNKIASLLIAFFGITIISATAQAETVIEISANDQMQFDKTAIEVPAGEVKLVFTNKGKLPKAAMGHNVVITKPGTNPMAFGAAAVAAAANEYIPQDATNAASIIAHTKLLGPGETDTITFTLEAGTYPFLCSFPGHFSLMKGTITAK